MQTEPDTVTRLGGWLFRIALHEIRLLLRRRQLQEPLPREFLELRSAAPDPERTLAAAQALAEVNRLFAADPCALKVIAGLAEGFTSGEICRTYAMTELEYDTTRKRMRRKLLRHDLAWSRR